MFIITSIFILKSEPFHRIIRYPSLFFFTVHQFQLNPQKWLVRILPFFCMLTTCNPHFLGHDKINFVATRHIHGSVHNISLLPRISNSDVRCNHINSSISSRAYRPTVQSAIPWGPNLHGKYFFSLTLRAVFHWFSENNKKCIKYFLWNFPLEKTYGCAAVF